MINKRKEYIDKIDKLECERARMLNENTKLYYDIEDLNAKRDKNVLLGIPFTLVTTGLVTVLLYQITHNPNLVATLVTIGGCSACGLGVEEIRLGFKIGKLYKKKEDNEISLDRNERELAFANQLLQSYERLESVSNEGIIVNKNNLVNNNKFVNNVVNSRNKVRSLAYKKVNNIRK